MNKEIEIPEGYEARIEGNKVILERKESEDEKIRKYLIDVVNDYCNGSEREGCIAYLEKQKEQKPAEWSEEDDVMLDKVFSLIHPGTKLTKDNADYCVELKQWIGSLRERLLKSLRPQPKQKDRYQEGFQDGVYEGRRKALEEYNKGVAFHYEEFDHNLSCYDGGPCTNPHFDCINCPRRSSVVNTYASPNIEYQSSTQPHWKPSEEDKDTIVEIINDLCTLKDWIVKYDANWLYNPILTNIDKRIAFLKSLRPQPNQK